ncbi:zinc-dependent metalloprotease [Balneola sp. MJW-20]|uniref:zinc-dependent metalloprotease n=1 Tax=Gracilimonas aurantiaca TaxID=3234185 RepID=UPI0034654AB9
MKHLYLILISIFLLNPVIAQEKASFKDKTKGLTLEEGYFDYYYDAEKARILLVVEDLKKEFLYANYLAAGVGSNDIGLDRSQQGGERVVYFEKRGNKLFLIQPNLSYKAVSDNALERKSVEEAFASSVLHAFNIEATKDGAYLIDLTPYLVRDSHDVSNTLRRRGEGSFTLDKNRSVVYEEGTFNFPMNSEFEVMLTFSGSNPGGQVRSVVPDPNAITVRTHHSFVQLPDDDFEPRKYDPRAGYYATSYMDYAAPIDEPMMQRFINRHRLQKKDPSAEKSEAVEPIVYYLDNGTPEPVRSALLDGAEWWNQAFEAAGYINAFQVKILPDDAHPLDIRYNVINWVHRSTRGWSYGGSVVDPRTGEIIKGNVLLGSLRVRQDYMIAQGLLSPFEDENAEDPRMMEMALARIRQLSAHEVGHTLGLYHNFASSVNGRESVMDYPHPQVDIVDGELSLENAYDTGIGEWDKIAIRYGYSDFSNSNDQAEELESILEDAAERGLKYISDNDARPQGGAHPYAHLWDYGTDPATQLSHILEVRKIALENFGRASIPSGTAMAELEEVLVPIYFFHRYQLEGTVKLIGGLDYTYKVKGDGQALPEIVDESTQRKALEEMIKAIKPDVLAIPENLLALIPPKPAGMSSTRESFRGMTGPSLDAYGIAETAAEVSISLILHPNRANRLVEYGSRTGNLGLGEVIDELIDATWKQEMRDDYKGSIQKIVSMLLVEKLIGLHASGQSSALTKAVVYGKLSVLMEDLKNMEDPVAMQSYLRIDSYLDDPSEFELKQALPAPPGSPIGSGWMEYCGN